MKTTEITISQGQFLQDVLPVIPTNTILAKTIPGIGATTLEIESKRHSIIIEPNVPVIKGKEQKHKNLFGVYESVSTNNVIDYLQTPLEKGKHKKIMTTPESFFKVMRAMLLLEIDCYKDYMLLFDECDKIIKDIDYRNAIALPIEDLQTKPTIVIISDLFYAKYSMIDPHTEAIQILGRFRNGISAIIHVSNWNPYLSFKTPEQLQNYLDGCHEVFMQIKRLFETATGDGVRETLKEALERITYAKYIDEDGNKNYFAIDNYFDEERVKSYYINPCNLEQAYNDTSHFTVKPQHKPLPLGDEDRLRISRADNKKEKRLEIIKQLDLLNGGEDNAYDEPLFREFRDSLHEEDTLIVEVYEALGADYAKQYLMSDKRMKLDLIKHHSENGKDRFAIMTSIYAIFEVGKKYPIDYIKTMIRRIYSSYGDNGKYTAKKIKDFFTVNDNVWIKKQRAYLLISKC